MSQMRTALTCAWTHQMKWSCSLSCRRQTVESVRINQAHQEASAPSSTLTPRKCWIRSSVHSNRHRPLVSSRQCHTLNYMEASLYVTSCLDVWLRTFSLSSLPLAFERRWGFRMRKRFASDFYVAPYVNINKMRRIALVKAPRVKKRRKNEKKKIPVWFKWLCSCRETDKDVHLLFFQFPYRQTIQTMHIQQKENMVMLLHFFEFHELFSPIMFVSGK